MCPDVILFPNPRSSCFALFTLFPACPLSPHELTFCPCWLKFCLFTQHWKYLELLWQLEAWLLPANSQFNTLPSLPQVVSLLLLHPQLHFLVGLAYCFPHYIDISVSGPYLEQIFEWIKTVYLSLDSYYPAWFTCLLQNLISCYLFD